ncbi:MAG: preprotein translocase subunit SecG [Porticoccus sp.]|nr:preprotein translocase subunit SecG [Porticoccus sp.]MBQ0807813.1 preprotein translocase subunit SecG [Porticoccus sp.]MDX2349468.1 preprotein translocase subunit SecG [Porticoccus sp.]
MEKIILIIHLLTALAIIGMILLQQGKGAEAGASFGSGASQTMLGSAGGWNFFSKATGILATVFFITSFGLAVIAKDSAKVGNAILPELEAVQQSLESAVPEVETTATVTDDIPVLEDEVTESSLEVPASGVE